MGKDFKCNRGAEIAMKIPWQSLSAEALTGLIEEFVTREGTDYGQAPVNILTKVEQVRRQLDRGEAYISYDEETETCTILPCR